MSKKNFILFFAIVIWTLTFIINICADDIRMTNTKKALIGSSLSTYTKSFIINPVIKKIYKLYNRYYVLHIVLVIANILFIIYIAHTIYNNWNYNKRRKIIVQNNFASKIENLSIVTSTKEYLKKKELESIKKDMYSFFVKILNDKHTKEEDLLKISKLFESTAPLSYRDRIKEFYKKLDF